MRRKHLVSNHQKGGEGVLRVALDLQGKGYTLFSPLVDEHNPIDLIAVKGKKILRLQVKYTSRMWKGSAKVKIRSGNGKAFDTSTIDYVAVWIDGWKDVRYLPASKAKQETWLPMRSKKWEEL